MATALAKYAGDNLYLTELSGLGLKQAQALSASKVKKIDLGLRFISKELAYTLAKNIGDDNGYPKFNLPGKKLTLEQAALFNETYVLYRKTKDLIKLDEYILNSLEVLKRHKSVV